MVHGVYLDCEMLQTLTIEPCQQERQPVMEIRGPSMHRSHPTVCFAAASRVVSSITAVTSHCMTSYGVDLFIISAQIPFPLLSLPHSPSLPSLPSLPLEVGPLPSLPLPFPPFSPHRPFPSLLPSPPLRSRPLKSSYGVWGALWAFQAGNRIWCILAVKSNIW